MPTKIPPLPTQHKIASILSAYDDLIENNMRRITILEEMAQSLYREWFVHFRFPGHEDVAMVESPLGPIPEGWEVKSVSDVAVVYRGRSYRSIDLSENGGLPFLNLKCIDRNGGFRRDGIKAYCGPYKESQTARAGDIIMAVTDMTQERRLVARAARVPDDGHKLFVLSMDLVRIAARTDISDEYLYIMFRFSGFADVVKQYANGANVLHLNPQHIEEFTFVAPPSQLQQNFAEFSRNINRQCDLLNATIVNLLDTRDLLLPKLISGEVDTSVAGFEARNA